MSVSHSPVFLSEYHYCGHCDAPNRQFVLWTQKTANGADVIFWRCETCGHRSHKRQTFVSKAWLWRTWELRPQDLPSRGDLQKFECSVLWCNEPGSEHHHWAPRAIFDNAEDWPTDFLCPKHHAEWHRMMLNAQQDALSWP